MKKLILMLFSLVALVLVASVGAAAAGVPGALGALFVVSTGLAYLTNSTPMAGRLMMAIGTLRPLKRGESNLGSILYLTVFTEDQFEPDTPWPVRGKGAIGDISLKDGETGARWVFDLGKGKGDSRGTGPITNKTYKHMLTGRTSGETQEQLDALDDTYNMGIIAIATYANGAKMVYGATQAPLHLTDESTTETAPESDGKGTNITLESVVGCDFKPRRLATGVTVPEAAIPAYPAQVNGVTP